MTMTAHGGQALWRATVLSLFPDMFPGPLGGSLPGKALADGVWSLQAIDIRAACVDKHRTVDDTPYGGGAGMVMRPDVIARAVDLADAEAPHARRLYLSPRGRRLDQNLVQEIVTAGSVLMLCGRYEGVDQRVLDAERFEEVSLGDFVLAGGEIAALALIEACVRLLPGVMGNAATTDEESFSNGLLEYPHYTRPPVWREMAVPEVLLSGHHEKVNDWRRAESERLTRDRRPDLWAAYEEKRAACPPKKGAKAHRND